MGDLVIPPGPPPPGTYPSGIDLAQLQSQVSSLSSQLSDLGSQVSSIASNVHALCSAVQSGGVVQFSGCGLGY